MRPAPLDWAAIPVVAPVEVAEHHTREARSKQPLGYSTRAGALQVKVSQLRCEQTPQITVDAVFTPSCLITMSMRAAPNPSQYPLDRARCKPGYFVKQFGDLTKGYMKSVKALKQLLYRPKRHPLGYGERGDEACQPYSHPGLADHTVFSTECRDIVLLAHPARLECIQPPQSPRPQSGQISTVWRTSRVEISSFLVNDCLRFLRSSRSAARRSDRFGFTHSGVDGFAPPPMPRRARRSAVSFSRAATRSRSSRMIDISSSRLSSSTHATSTTP